MLYENIDLWHFTVWQVYAARTICWKPTSDIRWACCWPKQICVWSSFCSWQCWHSTSLSLMFEFEEVEHIIQHIELSNKLWQHKYKCTCMRYVQNMEETTEDCFFTIPNDPTLDDYHIPLSIEWLLSSIIIQFWMLFIMDVSTIIYYWTFLAISFLMNFLWATKKHPKLV